MMNDPMTILVVDDNPHQLKLATHLLRERGYGILQAALGQEALRLAREHVPDLVLLDVLLPDLNGIEVCRRLKSSPQLKDSLVVLMSSLRTASDERAEGLEAGADGYIARPIANREFLARVEAMLRIRQAEAEREAALEALQESKRLLDATGRVARVGGWELDAETLKVRWTEETYRIHEVPIGHQPPLQEALDFFHPEDRERLSRAIDRALHAGESYDMELRFITARGNHLWARTICRPQIIDGQTVKLVGTFQDITERKQMEETLRTSDRRFRALFENMTEGVALHEMVYDEAEQAIDYTILQVNAAYERHTDLVPGTVVGRKATKVYGTDEPPYLDVYARVAATGQPTDFDVYFPPLGKHFRISAFSPAKGQFATIFEDITARKEGEKALQNALAQSRQSQKEAAALLEGARAVLEYRDFEVSARLIFDACKDLLGATAGYVALLDEEGAENELLFLDAGGLPCDVDPELPMPIRGLRADAYHTRQTVYENGFAESRWMEYLPGGHVLLENVLFAPLVLEGQALGLLGLANKPSDFSAEDARLASAFGELAAIALLNSRTLEALERSEADQARQAAALTRSNAELEQFARVISHDLQEPLRTVISYLGLLERFSGDQLDETSTEFIAYATDGASRMQQMIKSLLRLSQVSTQAKAFDEVDAETVLARVLDALAIAIEGSGAKVTCDPLPSVLADEAQLGQVFQNLIANAIKFRQAGQAPEVHVSAERRDGAWVFSVRDNGIGLDPAQADHIFGIFERLHTQDEYPGTGIGLALCKRIVERHGGEIGVDSLPGEGSTFFFSIPA